MNQESPRDKYDPVNDGCLDDVVIMKMRDWQSQHFSQLQKIGKSRGLNWQTTHLDRQPEDVKKAWILDRLVTYELYTAELRQKASQAAPGAVRRENFGGGGAGFATDFASVASARFAAYDSDIDGIPIDGVPIA